MEVKKKVAVGSSHRHGLSYASEVQDALQQKKRDSEVREMASENEKERSFHYNRNGVKCDIKPRVTNVYGDVYKTVYNVEVSTYANDDGSAYMEGEWSDSNSFGNYAGAVEWAIEQIQRRMDVHSRILESLGMLGMRLPEVMLEDGHGDERKYEEEQNGMDEEQELESIFTFDEPSEETLEENPNEDAKVLRQI